MTHVSNETFKNLREEFGITKAGFADALGISLTTLKKYETVGCTNKPVCRLIGYIQKHGLLWRQDLENDGIGF